ncbi:MAG TPA: chemotaxis protein CheB [Gemmatirosa sp.]
MIGASAGGVDALKTIVAALPADYPGAVFVVLHIPPSVPSVLASILGRASRLPCVNATDGAPVRPGTVYVAPPNRHLLLEPGCMRLVPGPRENGHRPAVDPLFRSASAAYGSRVIGVVLTGNLDDGTRGLLAITEQGGLAVVQHPDEANFPGMPLSAIASVPVDYVLPTADIAPLLAAAAHPLAAEHPTPMPDDPARREPEPALPIATDGASPAPPPNGVAPNGTVPNSVAANGTAPGTTVPNGTAPNSGPIERALERVADLETGVGIVDGGARVNKSLGGTVSEFTCPECHGALWELRDGILVRYRCRVGHSFTDQGLVDNKARSVEDALWTALTALEESAAIAARVAERAAENGRPRSAETFRSRAEYLEQRGAVLRELLNELPGHVDAN